LSVLEARLGELEASLKRGDGKSVFGRIFQVNNEIGRAVRDSPPLRHALLELQANVNAITVSLKAGDSSRALDALEASLRSFRKVKGASGSPKKNL